MKVCLHISSLVLSCSIHSKYQTLHEDLLVTHFLLQGHSLCSLCKRDNNNNFKIPAVAINSFHKQCQIMFQWQYKNHQNYLVWEYMSHTHLTNYYYWESIYCRITTGNEIILSRWHSRWRSTSFPYTCSQSRLLHCQQNDYFILVLALPFSAF